METKRYLDGELIVTRTESAGTVTETERYLFKDHLGSTDLMTDRTGAVEGAMSFDAFGLRRSANEFGSYTDADRAGFDTSVTTRGFTGHEGLDAVGLVHMNGRVYDPLLGRFISADPYIPAPHLTQSYNPYSYATNNPLSYVDPDGFFFKKLLRVAGTVASIVWAFHGNWIPLIINSLVNAAIELVPELGRVAQAFSYATVASSSLPGRSLATPSKMCIAANCLNATTEVEATVAETASQLYERAANGARTRSYIVAVSGGANANLAKPDSQAEEGALARFFHGIFNDRFRYQNLVSECERVHGFGQCDRRTVSELTPLFRDATEIIGAASVGAVVGGSVRSVGRLVATSGRPVLVQGPSGPVDISSTIHRINAGARHPHRNDGTVFRNREGLLPTRPLGYYREFVHPTHGAQGAGLQRIIRGNRGELYYSPDHYESFIVAK